jgi:hypothetical protein
VRGLFEITATGGSSILNVQILRTSRYSTNQIPTQHWNRPLMVIRTVLRVHTHCSKTIKAPVLMCNHGSQKLEKTPKNHPITLILLLSILS